MLPCVLDEAAVLVLPVRGGTALLFDLLLVWASSLPGGGAPAVGALPALLPAAPACVCVGGKEAGSGARTPVKQHFQTTSGARAPVKQHFQTTSGARTSVKRYFGDCRGGIH